MPEGDLPTRSDIISEETWDVLTDKQKQIAAFMSVVLMRS